MMLRMEYIENAENNYWWELISVAAETKTKGKLTGRVRGHWFRDSPLTAGRPYTNVNMITDSSVPRHSELIPDLLFNDSY